MRVDEKTVTVEVVGFHSVQVDIASLGKPLDSLITANYLFHAVAEVVNNEVKSLSDFECDGRTIDEQTRIIYKALLDKNIQIVDDDDVFNNVRTELKKHLILSFALIDDDAFNRLEKKNESTST